MRDQREHVEVAGDQRLPAAHEERPARPQHDRCGERELNPVRHRLVDERMTAKEVRAHLEHKDRRGRARGRSRSGASCRQVRDWARCRRWRSPVRAPCRRSGRCPARSDGSPGASGRCRWCLPARSPDQARHRRRDTCSDRRRIWCGSRRNRNSRCGPHGCGGARSCAGRPSCRRPDRSRRRSRPRRAAHGPARDREPALRDADANGRSCVPACDGYPWGVYSGHAQGSQDVMPAAAQPHRGPGSRPRPHGGATTATASTSSRRSRRCGRRYGGPRRRSSRITWRTASSTPLRAATSASSAARSMN